MKNDDLDNLNRLLDLYLKGRLSATQKKLLEQQLDNTKRRDNDKPLEFNQQHEDELWKRISAKTIDNTGRNRNWFPMAAAILVATIAAIAATVWNYTDTLSNKIILDDGTIVWLKDNSRLDQSSFSPDHREISLSGEALFEVTKDKIHPFTIYCGKYSAHVLGTSFNLKTTGNSIELTVLTGQVKLSSLSNDSSIIVQSHEHVVFTASKGLISKVQSQIDEVREVTRNTQYNMHFEDTRMDEIVQRVEGKFDVSIDLEDESLRNCMISADFTDQSLPLTLTMISEALGIRYEIEGKNITISGVGCKE
jgi:ferric-dicitrate binding protein FerR (iron transport regulator)